MTSKNNDKNQRIVVEGDECYGIVYTENFDGNGLFMEDFPSIDNALSFVKLLREVPVYKKTQKLVRQKL